MTIAIASLLALAVLSVADACPTAAQANSTAHNANSHYVEFVPNGGTGTMPRLEFELGSTYMLPTCAYTRSGCAFCGWSTRADGTGIRYADQAHVRDLVRTAGSTARLYAQWSALPVASQHIALNGVSIPVSGAVPNTATATSGGYEVTEREWLCGKETPRRFSSGKTYTFKAIVRVRTGWTAPGERAFATIDGFAATVTFSKDACMVTGRVRIERSGTYWLSPDKRSSTLVKGAFGRRTIIVATGSRGGKYKVTAIAPGAFASSRATTVYVSKFVRRIGAAAFTGSRVKALVVYTGRLTRSRVRGSLSGSAITSVRVNVARSVKRTERAIKKYKEAFSANNVGRAVRVRADVK